MLSSNALDREIVAQLPRGTRDFSLLQSAKTGSVAHIASYSTSTRVPSPEVKRPGREADHSLPSSAEVTTVKLYLYFPVLCPGLRRNFIFDPFYQSNFNTSEIRLSRYYKTGNARINVNTEAPSCNHRCHGKATRITDPECVFVALGTQHAMRMHHVVICGLPGSTIFSHIIS